MKEWKHHVKDERNSNISGHPVSFCGKPIQGFHFTGAGHVVAERQAGGRLLPCKKCKKIIIEWLNNEE